MTGSFLRELPLSFPVLSKVCLFGGTYLCEKLFSTMNFSTCGSRLTDAPLEAVLMVSTVNSIRIKKIKFKSFQGFHLLVQVKVYFK